MQLVIDIPEIIFELGFEVQNGSEYTQNIIDAVYKGTKVPKGHGRLIDADSLPIHEVGTSNYNTFYCVFKKDIDNAPTILEADKEDNIK